MTRDLIAVDVSRKRRSEIVDKMAAAYILQERLTGLPPSPDRSIGLALMTSKQQSSPHQFPDGSDAFPHRHLLGIAGLQPWEILFLLQEAGQWVDLNRKSSKHASRLEGLTVINAFFENSTRTLLSFEIAGKRMGADVVNMHAAQSSVEKRGDTD